MHIPKNESVPEIDGDLKAALHELGFDWSVEEGRLALAELLLKAGAGFRNSHTEEQLLSRFGLMLKDRTPNKKGRLFLCDMFYASSSRQPLAFLAMQEYRTPKS